MDTKTSRYYEANATQVCKRYNSVSSVAYDWIASWVPPGSRVLDVGAGSGRDVHKLLTAGYDAYGAEPVEALRREIFKSFPELFGRVVDARLPDLAPPLTGTFDAVVCNAVLMHLEDCELFDSFLGIKKRLSPNGYLFISLPEEREDLDLDGRDPDGRLFRLRPANYIRLLLERLGFREKKRTITTDTLGRKGVKWLNLVFQLSSSANSRPIDQLEGVLNNDKKDATYKLALIRALADVATVNHSRVRWDIGGNVGVPMSLLIDRWIAYYWPLIESDCFVPQRQSEEPNKKGQIAFRQDLLSLVDEFRLIGGYGQFIREINRPNPRADLIRLYNALRTKIRTTIVKGPITYAGGSLSNPIFGYEKALDLALLPQDLWIELSLLSHWVCESVILRWAEECARMGAKLGVKVSYVVDLLLQQADPVRTTAHARSLFNELPGKICVWTEKPLREKFDVDHMIPYSLWRNNDLWNLLPADPQINSRKRDRLPSERLLARRRDLIIHYWSHARSHSDARFEKEAESLISRLGGSWQVDLFAKVREAIELTAASRNIPRWEP